MEQTKPHFDVQPPEADALRSLYFLSHANPEAGIEDLKGLNLAEAAVMFMEEAELDMAPEYRERLQLRKYEAYCDQVETLIAENTHKSLTNAVYLASEELNLEQLSIAWYAREEYESARQITLNQYGLVNEEDVEQHFVDEASIARRYTDVVEFQIALELAANGFEGTGDALLKYYQYRLARIDKAVRSNRSTVTYMELAMTFARTEHERLISKGVPEHEVLYYAHSWMLNFILSAKGTSEDTKAAVVTQTVNFYENVIEDTLNPSNGRIPRNMVLASKLVADLIEFDPENKQYQKWRKRLVRHFTIQQYNLISPVYKHADLEYALHNLEQPTSDTIAMMADVSDLVGEKDYYKLS